jgi:16S rRNA (guanine(966)-N(2))-methyltransferase RsmD
VRIIGGEAGGRRLRAPRGDATRPTADRVKEAIFNILGPPPERARVLDLYAGAGSLGLEALSRGASEAVFVDRAADAARCVRENVRALGWDGRARVVQAEVPAALARLDSAGERFAWVFVDPPYASEEGTRALEALGGPRAGILDDTAVVVVEHDKRRAPGDGYGVLALGDRRRYGDTQVSFYGRAA